MKLKFPDTESSNCSTTCLLEGNDFFEELVYSYYSNGYIGAHQFIADNYSKFLNHWELVLYMSSACDMLMLTWVIVERIKNSPWDFEKEKVNQVLVEAKRNVELNYAWHCWIYQYFPENLGDERLKKYWEMQLVINSHMEIGRKSVIPNFV